MNQDPDANQVAEAAIFCLAYEIHRETSSNVRCSRCRKSISRSVFRLHNSLCPDCAQRDESAHIRLSCPFYDAERRHQNKLADSTIRALMDESVQLEMDYLDTLGAHSIDPEIRSDCKSMIQETADNLLNMLLDAHSTDAPNQ